MQRHVRCFVPALALFFILGFKASAEDSLAGVAKQQEPYTVTIALEFSRKNMNPVMRFLSMTDALGANGHATGFLVGDGLVMTSYHVVGGNLSARKRELLGFKPDDELEVNIYINGCQAKVVKVDRDADLALLRACTPRQKQQPTFRNAPIADEPLFLIAQPGEQKMFRRGVFNGPYTLGNASSLFGEDRRAGRIFGQPRLRREPRDRRRLFAV